MADEESRDVAFEIRVAGRGHIDAVVQCVEHAYSLYLERMDRPPAPMLADYAELIDRQVVHVAESEGRLIGLIVMWANDDHWYVDNIAVEPAEQGLGLGAALLGHADACARQAHQTEIRLYTNEVMWENIEYYPRMGFVETGRERDKGYDRVYFSRPVPPTS